MTAQPVELVIVRPAPTDADGYPAGDPVELVEGGWVLAPRGAGSEDNDRAAQVITGLTGYGPADTGLTAHDRVRINGTEWSVVGEVGVWVSPYPGAPSGCEAHFEKVTG